MLNQRQPRDEQSFYAKNERICCKHFVSGHKRNFQTFADWRDALLHANENRVDGSVWEHRETVKRRKGKVASSFVLRKSLGSTLERGFSSVQLPRCRVS